MFMRLKDGKCKAFTTSYDDGVVQDIRLMQLMDKYGIRGTFNISSGRYYPENADHKEWNDRMKRSEALELYVGSGHEVALHGYSHPDLTQLRDEDLLYEIQQDRADAEDDYGVLVRGMAYPYGTYSDRVITALKLCGICYSRTGNSSHRFPFPENWLELHPTCHHNDPKLMDLADRFLRIGDHYCNNSAMFCLYGHSYEFDKDDNWDRIEALFQKISGKEDVWYATNIELYDYAQAYKNLITSADRRTVYNPSAMDVWFSDGTTTYCIHPAETLHI